MSREYVQLAPMGLSLPPKMLYVDPGNYFVSRVLGFLGSIFPDFKNVDGLINRIVAVFGAVVTVVDISLWN